MNFLKVEYKSEIDLKLIATCKFKEFSLFDMKHSRRFGLNMYHTFILFKCRESQLKTSEEMNQ